MRERRILAVVCMVALALAFGVSANVIGWNFSNNWPAPTIQGDGVVDGFALWTDSVDNSTAVGTSVPNSTDAGAITTPINAAMVSVAWTSANMWQAGTEADPEQGLYRVYLDDGAGVNITVSGLSAWLASVGAPAYELRVYRSTDTTVGFSSVALQGGVETIPQMVGGLGDGSFPTGTGGGGIRGYQDSVGSFSDDVLTVATVREGDFRGTVSGFKITAVPEPATLGLMVAFGGLLLIRRKR